VTFLLGLLTIGTFVSAFESVALVVFVASSLVSVSVEVAERK